MEEAKIKYDARTSTQLQRQIYSFLTLKNKPLLSLPNFLLKQSPLRQVITIKYILPQITQIQLEIKPKQLIIKLFIQFLRNSAQSIQSITNFFNRDDREQLAFQIKSESTLTNVLLKAIALPTHLLNLIGDPKINTVLPMFQIQNCKKLLFCNILRIVEGLPMEDRVVVINKLLILKEQQTVIDYFVQNNPDYFISNFPHSSKQNNIVKYLYKCFITKQEGFQKDKIKRILTSIADKHPQSHTCFISLLNLNEAFLFSSERYKQFYKLFNATQQREYILKQLLLWWAVSKSYIVTSVQAKVRCNILAMIVQNMTKQELYSSNCLVSLTEGIKKRLTDGTSKNFASLIWKIIGEKLQIKLTEDIQRSEYFSIEEQPNLKNEIVNPQSQNFANCKNSKHKLQDSLNTHQESEEQSQQKQIHDNEGVVQIEPKNIYDCILGLRNQYRKEATLKKLPSLIKRYKQDLILMWNTLIRELLSPLKQQYIPILVQLFSMRPQEFIEGVVMFFMKKQNNISEKTYLMQTLKQGIQELSTSSIDDEQSADQAFYFKKIKSKYFKQPQIKQQSTNKIEEKQSRTRRWGHTRIAHQRQIKGISLNFLQKQSSINRFYPIANLLYYKIIDIMSIGIIQNLRAHQVHIHSLLKLISVFISNIKNHFDKYIIISDISSLCWKIIQQLIENNTRENNRYQQTGGLTLMLTLQIINKISLVIDKYVSENIMQSLKLSIEGSRKLPNYGMAPVIRMVEANIYQRVYASQQ